MSLPELSIKRPVLATVMTAALVLLGAVSLLNLNIAEYPNMSYPYVSVHITYDGARPEQMDAQIVRKVEEAVSEARGVRHITSTSTEGNADIGIEFVMEIEAAAAAQEVRDKVSAIKEELPSGGSEPVVSRFDMNADPVAAIAITSDKLSQRELSILVEDTVKDRTSAARYDEVPAIGIEVGKQSGGNAVKVAAAVKEELNKLQEKLPDSVQVHLVRDDAQRIKDSMHGVYEDLILGGIFAVMISLFISFTLTPMLASKFLRPEAEKKGWLWDRQRAFSRWFDGLALRYGEFLAKVLAHHRKKIALLAVGLFVASLSLLGLIGMDMLPSSDKGQFTVKYELQDGVSLVKREESTRKMAELISKNPSVEHVYATSSTSEAESLFVKLKPKKEREASQEEIIAQVRQELNAIPGVKVYLEGLSDMGERPIAISLAGADMNKLGEASDMVAKALEEMPGAIDVTSSYKPGSPRLSIFTKEARAHDLGVTNETIGSTVSTLLEGKKTGKFSDTDEQVDVRLRLAESARENPSQLNLIQVATGRTKSDGTSQLVPLAAVSDWKYETSPGSIRRYDRQKEVRVSANVDGMSLGEFENLWAEKLESLELPAGVSTGSAGEAAEMDETMNSILQTLVLGIAFIFMILAAQFESFLEPLAMMMGMLPLALAMGPGAEARAPMAHAILGGLITSTLLTLVVIPCLYSLLKGFLEKRQGKVSLPVVE